MIINFQFPRMYRVIFGTQKRFRKWALFVHIWLPSGEYGSFKVVVRKKNSGWIFFSPSISLCEPVWHWSQCFLTGWHLALCFPSIWAHYYPDGWAARSLFYNAISLWNTYNVHLFNNNYIHIMTIAYLVTSRNKLIKTISLNPAHTSILAPTYTL